MHLSFLLSMFYPIIKIGVGHMRKEFFSVPNILTYLRILLIPFFLYAYYYVDNGTIRFYSMIILFISAITDFLDGFIARRYKQITSIGKLLDPIADKLYELVLALVLMKDYPLFKYILFLFIAENAMLLGFGFYIFKKKGVHLDGAHLPGKIATALFFIFSLLMITFNMKDTLISRVMSISLLISVGIATIYYFRRLWNLLMRDVYENT
ncbi:MAG TPA: CDP-diacylglycerol--glycerol-3-phosphate 3-phosphatidyltransferase [Kandleria vitulina]|nr:CDP-diacylglycerol--glycerol-3-phosphate 3-phosphatidyltransferase [Kandleria vitulina]